MSRQRQSSTSKREIKMRKSVVVPLVAAVMAFGSWLPSAAVARPPEGSQARCFANYESCYHNSGKCIFPSQCRDVCEAKYKACNATATPGGWNSLRGGPGGSAVTISSGTALVTKPGSPAAGQGTTAVTISSGGALVTAPGSPAVGKGTTAVTVSSGAALVSAPNGNGKSAPAAASSGASTRSHSGGGGSLNGVGNGGATKIKQQ